MDINIPRDWTKPTGGVLLDLSLWVSLPNILERFHCYRVPPTSAKCGFFLTESHAANGALVCTYSENALMCGGELCGAGCLQ
jgi:hypothetical protein